MYPRLKIDFSVIERGPWNLQFAWECHKMEMAAFLEKAGRSWEEIALAFCISPSEAEKLASYWRLMKRA